MKGIGRQAAGHKQICRAEQHKTILRSQCKCEHCGPIKRESSHRMPKAPSDRRAACAVHRLGLILSFSLGTLYLVEDCKSLFKCPSLAWSMLLVLSISDFQLCADRRIALGNAPAGPDQRNTANAAEL
ncbi:hypothetical protein FB451DRAFT_1169273 [Mycena latifolia]|nr:hypothetical protein FB451DRAFT_1169273 [Mycena latifolia]